MINSQEPYFTNESRVFSLSMIGQIQVLVEPKQQKIK